jgi:hypothetical protein
MSDLGSKALQVLKTVAPMIGTAFGGPLGGLAVKAIESAFGGEGTATDTALLSATPDQLLALKKADNDFKVQMQALGVQEEQLAYADTASARAREASVRDLTPQILAYGITIGFFGVLGYVMHVGLHTLGTGQGGEAVLLMLGSLGTAWAGIVSYYFGSSTGAQRSGEALASIAKQPNGK